jgi:hypothetical protein
MPIILIASLLRLPARKATIIVTVARRQAHEHGDIAHPRVFVAAYAAVPRRAGHGDGRWPRFRQLSTLTASLVTKVLKEFLTTREK